MDGNNGLRIAARVPVLVAVTLAFWVTSGIARADPSLPDPSAPIDAASSAASSAADEAAGAVDSATSAADDVVSAASTEAESAADSVVSTTESAAEAASGAAGSAPSSASQAGGGAAGASSSGAAGGSTGSSPSSSAVAGSGDVPAAAPRSGGGGERGKRVSRYDGGSSNRTGGGDKPRGARAMQAQRESDAPARSDKEDDRGRIGDLSQLVQSGQEIGDSTTVSVVTSSDRSDDPPLFEGLPITGFEVSVLFAVGAGLASLGVALLSWARQRSDSGRARLS